MIPALPLVLAMFAVQRPDSARRVADTLFIEPLGVRVIVPALWMGRVSERDKGRGTFRCQLDVAGPVTERIVVDPARLRAMTQGLYGPSRSSQDALDTILPMRSVVAHVGGGRFNGSCVAPQIHLYVLEATAFNVANSAATTQRIIEKQYSGIQRVERDSAAWHVIAWSWTEAGTDFVRPATLEILSRQFGTRLLVVAVMDAWSARAETQSFLASIR